jgi:glycosyltransferase involved in cell wall biosynthesis
MKILLISEYFPASGKCEIKGGVETRAFYFAKELAKKHEVVVLASWEAGTKKEDRFENIRVIRCGPEREYSQLGSVLARLSFIREAYLAGINLKPDLVDGYNFVSYIPAMWIAKRLGIPAVATYHDVWIGEWVRNVGVFSGIAGEIAERYVLAGKGRKWAKFITNSDCTREELIKFGVPADKVDKVYSGVELDKYTMITVSKYDDPTVVYVGRLVKYKRVDDLIRAIAEVRKSIKGIKCKIIGSGPEKENLKCLAGKLGLDNVELLGFVEKHEDVIRVVKSSHVFCLPSEVEGLGLVTIEAMACGVPFVNSRIPPTVEATEGGKGGLLFRVGDYKELAGQVVKLLSDSKLYDGCVEQEKKVVAKYDWKNLVKGVEQIYAEIVSDFSA